MGEEYVIGRFKGLLEDLTAKSHRNLTLSETFQHILVPAMAILKVIGGTLTNPILPPGSIKYLQKVLSVEKKSSNDEEESWENLRNELIQAEDLMTEGK